MSFPLSARGISLYTPQESRGKDTFLHSTYMKANYIPTTKGTSYPVFENMEKAIACAKEYVTILKNIIKRDKYTIVCRGTSGIILSTLVYNLISENVERFDYCRKPGENSHSCGRYLVSNRYPIIIIDDFIAKGDTMRAIWEHLKDNDEKQVTLVKILIAGGAGVHQDLMIKLFPNVEYLIG